MLELLFIGFAPVLQIVWSALRLRHRVAVSLIVIAGFCCLLGIILSAILLTVISNNAGSKHVVKQCIDCVPPHVYMGFLGLIATPVFSLLIVLIARLFFKRESG
jgi:hypothetical protein